MKKVVVTGPTGVIGSAVIKKLIAENCKVYAVIRKTSKRIANIIKHDNVKIIYCDVADVKLLPEKIGENCDIFYHLAWTGTDNPANRMNMYIQIENVRYALDAAEAAHSLGCSVFVGCGSQAEYGNSGGIINAGRETNPVSGYGMAKLCAGQMTRVICQKYGIKHIWPRIVSVYGINDGEGTLISTVIRSLRKGESPRLTKCEQIWDYLYSEDAAEALWAMAEKGQNGAVYVLGSGQNITLKECVELIKDELHSDVKIEYGVIPYYADQIMFMQADIEALTADTGWRPKTPFRQGIRKLLEYVAERNDV